MIYFCFGANGLLVSVIQTNNFDKGIRAIGVVLGKGGKGREKGREKGKE